MTLAPSRRRATLLAVAFGALALALSACGGDDPAPTPTIGNDASAAEPSEAESSAEVKASGVPPVSPPVALGERAKHGVRAYRGEGFPSDGAEKAVAAVLVKYMQARLDAYHTATNNVVALSNTAIGEALAQPQNRALELEQEKLHNDGNVWVNIQGIAIDGKAADITSCMQNSTADVDENHVAVEDAPAAYQVTGTARNVGQGAWLIETITFEPTAGC